MPKKRKQSKVSDNKQHIARITKKKLALLIGSLSTILAILIFKPGFDFWPMWMIYYRTGFIGIAGFLTLILILMSPIIVVTESDPRRLSGPGETPKNVI